MRHFLLLLFLLPFSSIVYCQKGTFTNAEAYGIQVIRSACDYPEYPSGQLILIKRKDASKSDTFPWMFYQEDSLQILFNDTMVTIFNCLYHPQLFAARYGAFGITQTKEVMLMENQLNHVGMPQEGREYLSCEYKLTDAGSFSIITNGISFGSTSEVTNRRQVSNKRYYITLNKKTYPIIKDKRLEVLRMDDLLEEIK